MDKHKRDKKFETLIYELGLNFSDGYHAGGKYLAVKQDNYLIYISGQIPKIGNQLEFQGTVCDDVTIEQAKMAAKICILRAIGVTKEHIGSLNRVHQILRMNVYIQATKDFEQHSEIADAASEILEEIFGENGAHTRTSVGVLSLPKNSPIELDLTLSII